MATGRMKLWVPGTSLCKCNLSINQFVGNCSRWSAKCNLKQSNLLCRIFTNKFVWQLQERDSKYYYETKLFVPVGLHVTKIIYPPPRIFFFQLWQCEYLLSDHSDTGSVSADTEEGLDPNSAVYKAIMSDSAIQLGLSSPRSLIGQQDYFSPLYIVFIYKCHQPWGSQYSMRKIYLQFKVTADWSSLYVQLCSE